MTDEAPAASVPRNGPSAGWLRTLWLPAVHRAARASIAGPDRADALAECQALAARTIASTIGFWNRSVDLPVQVRSEAVAVLRALRTANLDCYLSLKPHALDFRPDLLREVAGLARDLGIHLHFDSGPHALADAMFGGLDDLSAIQTDLGCAIPGRWRRSPADAERALASGLTIRVVKGQWIDPVEPRRDPRAGFLEVVDVLAGRARHVRVATHDAPLAREALVRLRAAGTSCELELIVGLPVGPALQVARTLGVPVRGYVAYGDPALLYPLRDAAGSARILAQFLRCLAGRSRSEWGRP